MRGPTLPTPRRRRTRCLRLPLREREADCLAWLHSDTPEGQWCATILRDHDATLGYDSTLHESTGLGYHEAIFTERGLRTLLAEPFGLISAADWSVNVTIRATGGFKAEIAYLNLVGLLLGIDVYYLHEQFRELVSLPRLPLDWNKAWVADNVDFLEWVDAEPRATAVVENRLWAPPPDLCPLMANADDGNSYSRPMRRAGYWWSRSAGAGIVERLDALESLPDAVPVNTRRRSALPWFGKDACWVSRVESGDVAKLDRRTVVALCRALDCSHRDRTALLLAAGLSPYPIPACESWEELLRWYRCAAELLPDAGHVMASADVHDGQAIAAPLQ